MKRLTLLAAIVLAVGCSHDADKDKSASAQRYKSDTFGSMKSPSVNADTRFAAGQLAETQGNKELAIAQYEQALHLDAKHIPSLYRMGVVLTQTRQFDKAVTMWNRYIEATNKIASGYSNLGFTYEMAGDVSGAEKAYQQGLSIDPKSEPCRVNYGLMLARHNRQSEAQAQLSEVLPPAEVAFNLAAVYEQQGAIPQAREELKKAIEADPQMIEAKQKLASLPND